MAPGTQATDPSSPASGARRLACFDVVRQAGVDLSEAPLCDRRRQLEPLLGPARPNLQLIARTASVDHAEEWLAFVPGERCSWREQEVREPEMGLRLSHAADLLAVGWGAPVRLRMRW